MGKRPFSPDLLKKYLANQCSEEEQRILDNWYNGLSLEDRDAPYNLNEEDLLAKIKAEIAEKEDRNNPVPQNSFRWLWRISQ